MKDIKDKNKKDESKRQIWESGMQDIGQEIAKVLKALYVVNAYSPEGDDLFNSVIKQAHYLLDTAFSNVSYTSNLSHKSTQMLTSIQKLILLIEVSVTAEVISQSNAEMILEKIASIAEMMINVESDVVGLSGPVFTFDFVSERPQTSLSSQILSPSSDSAYSNTHQTNTQTETGFLPGGIAFASSRKDTTKNQSETQPVTPSQVKKNPNSPKPIPKKTNSNSQAAGGRKERILSLLARKGQVSISDITSEFPDVSSKTIQRDLAKLVAEDKVEKFGEKRWSTYKLLG